MLQENGRSIKRVAFANFCFKQSWENISTNQTKIVLNNSVSTQVLICLSHYFIQMWQLLNLVF